MPAIIAALFTKGLPWILNNIPLVSRILNGLIGNKPWFKSFTVIAGIVWAIVFAASGALWLPAPILAFFIAANSYFTVLGPLLLALGIRKAMLENLKAVGIDVQVPPTAPIVPLAPVGGTK